MRSPFDWVVENAQPWLLLVLTLFVVGIGLRMSALDSTLATQAAPLGIVSYELAGTADVAGAILDSWNEAARSAAMFIQGLDALFLIAYAGWLSLASVRLGRRLTESWRTSSFIVSWGVLLAAPFDALENFALVQQLLHGPSSLYAGMALLFAIPKFALVAIALLFLLAGGLKSLVMPGSRPQSD